jgi:hypothetical protein
VPDDEFTGNSRADSSVLPPVFHRFGTVDCRALGLHGLDSASGSALFNTSARCRAGAAPTICRDVSNLSALEEVRQARSGTVANQLLNSSAGS